MEVVYTHNYIILWEEMGVWDYPSIIYAQGYVVVVDIYIYGKQDTERRGELGSYSFDT